MKKKSFYYIESRENHIALTLEMLDSGSLPLVWYCCGVYNVFPREYVENVISNLTDWDKIEHAPSDYCILWDNSMVEPHCSTVLRLTD